MNKIPGAVVVIAVALTMGCATNGLQSSTSTVFGIQVDASANSVPSFKIGLIRSEVIDVNTNAFPNANVIKATDVESVGFLKNRVRTSLAIGATAVAQPSVGQPMPHAGISTNQP